jgi:hypothetical protein
MYFVQGVAEPSAGLLAQPLQRTLERSWGLPIDDVSAFFGWIAFPWALKPLYGLCVDFLPFGRSRRRNLALAATTTTALGFLFLTLFPIRTGELTALFVPLVCVNVAIAFTDVVVDALMISIGQPLGITARLQAAQWGSIYAAQVIMGLVGGLLAGASLLWAGFLICGGFAVLSWCVVLLGVREPAAAVAGRSFLDALRALGRAICSPVILGVGGFLFLWNVNPFSSVVLQSYATQTLGMSDTFYGLTISIQAGASVLGAVAFGAVFHRVPPRLLMHTAIVLGIVSTLAYWGFAGTWSAVGVSAVFGFAYVIATLSQLDLAARTIPPAAAGTMFALLMAISNLGMSRSIAIGGELYKLFTEWWGVHLAFDALVAVGAASTAACWVLTPLLNWLIGRREAAERADGDGPTPPAAGNAV